MPKWQYSYASSQYLARGRIGEGNLPELRLYETTPKWHDFLVINPVALAADSRAEKRTAEYRMSNNE